MSSESSAGKTREVASLRITRAVVLIVFLVGAAITYHLGAWGFNRQVYIHFAELQLDGFDPYHPPAEPAGAAYDPSHDPAYLGYSGFSHAVFVTATWIWRHTRLNALVLYSLALFALVLLVLDRLRAEGEISASQFRWTALLALAPPTWDFLFRLSFEDKMQWPLAILLFVRWRERRPLFAAATVGFFTGWIGLPALFAPLLLIDAWRGEQQAAARWKRIAMIGAVGGAAFVIAMLPYFPASLQGWQIRAAMDNGRPLWDSPWRIIGSLYVPGMNKAALLLTSGFVWRQYAMDRWNAVESALALMCGAFLTSILVGTQHVVPLVMLAPLAVRSSRARAGVVAMILLIEGSWEVGVRGFDALVNMPPAGRGAAPEVLWICAPYLIVFAVLIAQRSSLTPRPTATRS